MLESRRNHSISFAKSALRFTVLTPTYNRAHLLGHLYASLCAQTFRDFEWLIVDDGSTDNTRELVAQWQPEFPVRYVWKRNGGKHTAVNLGVRLAAGEFILITDSDDRWLPHALERFDYHWKQIPDPHRFAFVVASCRKEDGRILGRPVPGEYVDVAGLAQAFQFFDSDRCAICRTDVLRQFMYPEFPGETFILESVVWHRIL
jgi:glycosyltransferase involved in cell wall biosynthesis